MRFEEGYWYFFTIDSVVSIPEKGNYFVLRHESGRKMLLNTQYYVKYNFQIGQVIECRVDKVNCTGKVYLEPKHPFYTEGFSYNFDLLNSKISEDNTISITVRDYFDNEPQVLVNSCSIEKINNPITLKVERVKKGIPTLSFLDDNKVFLYNNNTQKLKLKLAAIVHFNSEDYYSLVDGEKVVARLKVKHYKNYGFVVGKYIDCQVIGCESNGLLIVDPKNPWYKIGESYRFKIYSIDDFLDLNGDTIKSIIVLDNNGRKCGVKYNNANLNQLSSNSEIKCKVIGFRKGRPLLEIDPN